MKKIFNYGAVAVLMIFAASCDKGLDELNRNTTSPTVIDPVFQLNTAVINTSFPTASIIYEEGIVQQMVTPNSGV
jgi:hypothetical protein